jgi:hypothetical protein
LPGHHDVTNRYSDDEEHDANEREEQRYAFEPLALAHRRNHHENCKKEHKNNSCYRCARYGQHADSLHLVQAVAASALQRRAVIEGIRFADGGEDGGLVGAASWGTRRGKRFRKKGVGVRGSSIVMMMNAAANRWAGTEGVEDSKGRQFGKYDMIFAFGNAFWYLMGCDTVIN